MPTVPCIAREVAAGNAITFPWVRKPGGVFDTANRMLNVLRQQQQHRSLRVVESAASQESPLSMDMSELTRRCYQLFSNYRQPNNGAAFDPADFARVQSIFELQSVSQPSSNDGPQSPLYPPAPPTIGFTMDDAVFIEYSVDAVKDMRNWVLNVLEWAETVLHGQRLYLCVTLPGSHMSAKNTILRSLVYVGFHLHLPSRSVPVSPGCPQTPPVVAESHSIWLSYEL